uniref:Ubiquitin carboxyl-terminal hydrolase n=1 Tax=Plectus sambesii TaxID=2011161 RepID=A0A914W4D3_9BILA
MPAAKEPTFTDLQYGTFEVLKQKCSKLHPSILRSVQSSKMSSEKVYKAMVKRSFDEANLKLREGNQEDAYELLRRCGEIGQLMLKKDDFSSFKRTPEAKDFHTLFTTTLSKIEELELCLDKRYQLQAEEKARTQGEQKRFRPDLLPDGRPPNSFSSIPANTISDVEIGLLVTPKQLAALVDAKSKSTKSVVVLDCRDDSERRSLFKYMDNGRITVVNIPANIVQPGCIAGKLVNQLPVNERGLLQRLKEADLVVLMESKHSPLTTDRTQLVKGSKAQMLFDAITLYNMQYSLKRRPTVLDGGFENWSMHYPMYTTAAQSDSLNDVTEQTTIGDSFAAEIARFRRQFSLNVDYPNLDYIPPPAVPSQLGDFILEMYNEPPIHYPEPRRVVQPPPPSRPTIPDRNLKPSSTIGRPPTPPSSAGENLETVKPAEVTAPAGQREVAEEGRIFVNEHALEVDEAPKLHDEVGEERQRPTVVNPPPAVLPAFDRSKKPIVSDDLSQNGTIAGNGADTVLYNAEESRAASGGSQHSKGLTNDAHHPPGHSASEPRLLGGARLRSASRPDDQPATVPSRPSVPDRSMKPQDSSTEELNTRLVAIYRMMCDDISQRSTAGHVTPGCTGLYNQGNTCFMNATLQALSNSPPLREIFANRKFIRHVNRQNRFGTQGVISSVFGALIDSMWSGQYRAINPSQFLATFASSVNRDMGDRRQHDAQEFQIFLLGALHEDLNSVTVRKSIEQKNEGKDLVTAGREAWRNAHEFSRSPVNDVFQLQAVSILQCSVCHMQSPTFEEMTQGLTLELPDNRRQVSLSDSLRQHFAREILDGSSRWHCPRCRQMQVATKQTSIWRLPNLLVIHLKRFSPTATGWVKNEVAVDFPVNYLDLTDLMHPDTDAPPATYSLYAVTNHFGRMESGHYTSFARNSQTKQWLKFDDEVVSPLGVEGSVKTGAAYILFYARN